MAETRCNGVHAIRKKYVDLKLSSNMVDLIINYWSKVLQCISNSYSKMSLECLTKSLATLLCILS